MLWEHSFKFNACQLCYLNVGRSIVRIEAQNYSCEGKECLLPISVKLSFLSFVPQGFILINRMHLLINNFQMLLD